MNIETLSDIAQRLQSLPETSRIQYYGEERLIDGALKIEIFIEDSKEIMKDVSFKTQAINFVAWGIIVLILSAVGIGVALQPVEGYETGEYVWSKVLLIYSLVLFTISIILITAGICRLVKSIKKIGCK